MQMEAGSAAEKDGGAFDNSSTLEVCSACDSLQGGRLFAKD